MNNKIYLSLILLVVLFICQLPQQAYGQDKECYQSLKEAFSLSLELRGDYDEPTNIQWINNGNRYSYVKRNYNEGYIAIHIYNPATRADTVIFKTNNYTFPNYNDVKFSFLSFRWTDDFQHIIFQSFANPDTIQYQYYSYYLYSLKDQSLKLLSKHVSHGKISPDITKIGFLHEGNLYVEDISSNKVSQLTFDNHKLVHIGEMGWVYDEEFGINSAWKWSPNSKYIAYWKVDERKVPVAHITNYKNLYTTVLKKPYPKPGETNPDAKIGVANVKTGKKQWLDLPDKGYIPRIYWTSKGNQLAVVHLNRLQNHLKLFFCNINNGKCRLIMQEKSDTWIELNSYYVVSEKFYFPEHKKEFFWISNRDGWSHIYRYNYKGELLGQVTTGQWEVTSLLTVNYKTGRVYYISTEASPLQRQLYSINLDGTDKRRLTVAKGTHRINLSPNGRYYIDQYSSVSTPPQISLWSTKKGKLKTFERNNSVKEFIHNHVYSPKVLFSFTTSDGQQLDGYFIKPMNFDSTKSYPLLLNVYGGPGSQSVYNTFANQIWEQYLAQQGFVVARVNNRGSGGYGRNFEHIVYKHLGKWEAHDFVETAKYLASKSWIDGDRMAIRGHSYGGYMTAYTMLKYPGVFKVAIAEAPVTDWRFYDSIYTERYMGLPENNEEGYKKSAVTAYAGNLEGHLMIIAGMMDDNVLVQNTMQLLTALINAGEDVDLEIYPPGDHSVVFNPTSSLLISKTKTKYLKKYLNPHGLKCNE